MKPLLALALIGACQVTDEAASIPWLHGLSNAVSSNRGSDEVARRMDTRYSDVDPECASGSYPGIEIEADVASPSGSEIVMVSLAHGIVITDREGALIAETPGSHCEGHKDELVVVGAGSAFGARTIALAATTTSTTWLTLFRVAERRVDPVFTGIVEEAGDRGAVFLLPGALIYRSPRGTPTVWIYSSDARAYVQPTVTEPELGRTVSQRDTR